MNKFAPHREDKLVSREEINDELRQIEEAPSYYITPKGKIYREYDDKFYPMKSYINKHNGYVYNTLRLENGKPKSFRTHILTAKAYISNPDNLPVVGHKDNNKANPAADNLEYCTYSENTQKAVNDKLLCNDKGFDDSQSIPVVAYNLSSDTFKIYGSISEAIKDTNTSKSTIKRQMDRDVKSTRCGYIFSDMYEIADVMNFKFSNDYRNHT